MNSKVQQIIEKFHGTGRGAQVEFARKAGITEGYASHLLSGKRQISLEMKRRLTKVYGLEESFWAEAPGEIETIDPGFMQVDRMEYGKLLERLKWVESSAELKGKFEYAHKINMEFLKRIEGVLSKCESVLHREVESAHAPPK